jgi:hypothetical protein
MQIITQRGPDTLEAAIREVQTYIEERRLEWLREMQPFYNRLARLQGMRPQPIVLLEEEDISP